MTNKIIRMSDEPPSEGGGSGNGKGNGTRVQLAVLEERMSHLATKEDYGRLDTKVTLILWLIPIALAIIAIAVRFLPVSGG